MRQADFGLLALAVVAVGLAVTATDRKDSLEQTNGTFVQVPSISGKKQMPAGR